MDTSCSVGPLCASSHSSSIAERSAFESTAMATAKAADTALDNADVKAAAMAADCSSSAEDIAAWKRGRGGGEEEADHSVIQWCIRRGAKVKEKNTFVQFYSS